MGERLKAGMGKTTIRRGLQGRSDFSGVKIETPTAADYTEILALNESGLPHVNRISTDDLAEFAAQCRYFKVAREAGRIDAFLLAFSERAAYDSPNFLWFRDRYPRFVYIDRIVVAPSRRRSGIARILYADLEREARAHAPDLTCEVNLDPPNPGSLEFHERSGFLEVGRQHTGGGEKYVCLMSKDLSTPAGASD
jgi:predicted GNAT superfamily acetyltransferase